MFFSDEIKEAHISTIQALNKHMPVNLKSKNMYIYLKPFYRLDNKETPIEITKELGKQEISDELSDLPSLTSYSNIKVYSINFDKMPKEEDFIGHYEIISWNDIKTYCNFGNYDEVNAALRTHIGALRREYERQDLAEKLVDVCKSKNISIPVEGYFDTISKDKIFNYYQNHENPTLIIIDEYIESKKQMNLKDIDRISFCKEIKFKDYYLIEDSMNLFWSVGWDDFFYVIDGERKHIDMIIESQHLEGFYLE